MTKTPKRSSDLANGETSEGDPPTSRDSVANALDRWDEEGGAPAVPWPLPYETGDLLDAERRVRVAATPDGNIIASVADDMVCRRWDVSSSRLIHERPETFRWNVHRRDPR